jgi:alpha-D-xyloside xylohydrolase
MARDGDGAITRTGEGFALQPDECIYGLGERFMPANRRGQRIEAWNFNTWGTSNERAYKNVPFFLSTAGYGVFVNTTCRARFDFGSGQGTSLSAGFEVEDDRLDFYLFFGPNLKDVLDRYTDVTGKAPVPPMWSFGLWMGGMENMSRAWVEGVATRLRAERVPCDVMNPDHHWMRDKMYADLVWDESRYPDPPGMIAKLKAMGFRIVPWIQPWIPKRSEVFAEAAERGVFARRQDGSIYLYNPTIPYEEANPSGIVDFTNPAAVEWYTERIGRLVKMGVDGFKCDFGEAIPEDGVFYTGIGRQIHNIYAFYYNKTVYEALQKHHPTGGVVWGRSAWAGSQRFPIQWSGDPWANFEHMACTLWAGISYGLSGMPFWSHDIGGYHGTPSAELFLRWAAFGLLTSHSRLHGDTPREPWAFGQETLDAFRELVELRYRLLPYILSCAHEAHLTGVPVLRAMVLEFQEDPMTRGLDLQYMFGPSLLVAPIIRPGGHGAAYLPEGSWREFWTGCEVSGPKYWRGQVPLNRIPLFQRQDSIVPLGPVLQRADGAKFDALTLLVNLAHRASMSLRDDGGELVVSVIRKDVGVNISVKGTDRSLNFQIRGVECPRHVRVDSTELAERSSLVALEAQAPGWFRDENGVIHVMLATESKTSR